MAKRNKLRMLKIGGIALFNLICVFSIVYCLTTGAEKNQAISGENAKVINEFEGTRKLPPPTEPKAKVAQARGPAAPASIKYPDKVFIVDDFSGDEVKNKIGAKANIYVKAPSKIMTAKREDVINAKNSKALMIRYDKKNAGGPNGTGGWCGYYTILKNERTGQYLEGSDYKYLTFWVKGDKGGENFMVGLADEHWDRMGDSLKSDDVGAYLEAGKVTTQWQKARVPLSIFFLDLGTLAAVTINFESECFPDGAGSGTIYIADIAFEK